MPAALLALLLAASARADLGLTPPRGARAFDPATGVELEIGDLSAGAAGTLLGSSPYLSLGKTFTGTGEYLDWGLKVRASAVDLQSRWFSSVAAPDPALRDGVDPTATSRERLYVLSAVGNVGRAYNLRGPLDAAWSAMGMFRLDQVFPSAALDQTVGARLRLRDGQSVGVFGGVTETAALLSDRWATALVTRDKVAQPRLATAPHVEAGAWGPLPVPGASYRAFAGVQKNPNTELTRLEGSLLKQASPGVVSVSLRAEKEIGRSIDFNRDQRALRVALAQRGGVEWSVETGKRKLGYGGASLDDSYMLLGLTVTDQPTGRSVTLGAATASGELSSPAPAWAGQAQKDLSQGLARLDDLLHRASAALAGAANEVDAARLAADLNRAYAALPAELRASLEKETGGAPDFDKLARELAAKAPAALARAAEALDAEAAKVARLQAALSDPRRLENIVTRFVRVQIYEALQGTHIRLWGRDMPLTPGLTIAAMHAYGMGVAVVAPARAGELGPAIDAYLADRLRQRFGLSCSGGDLVGCALSGLPPELKTRLEGLPAQKARELVADALGIAGETLRLEINRFLLSLYVSAKQLDALTVERGETLGTLNREAALASFARLDERREREQRRENPSVELYRATVELGAKNLAAETELQSRRLQALLAERGASLSRELAEAGVEAPAHDLARLIGGYGEDVLRAFAASAKAKLRSRGSVRLTLRLADTVAIIREKDGALTLNVPPAEGPRPGKMLDAVVQSL